MGRIHYELPDDLHRELKARAALEGVTLKDLIIRFLTEGLERKVER
jgi:plasmid stability protein